MKTLSILALSVIVGLGVVPRADAAAQSNQTRDRSRSDQVCVYKDINYQGPEQCYGPGEVSNLGTLRQSISSIRVYGRATVTVYEDTDFRGRSAQFTSDVADLGRQMMSGNTAWSDHIDSLRIGGNAGTSNVSNSSDRSRTDQVCLYADVNYQGSERCFGIGEVSNLGALRPGISSIRVYGRATITIYENADFRGSSAQFTSDVPDLTRQILAGNTTWNDRVSSVRISGNSGTYSGTSNVGRDRARNDQVCVYKDVDYQGQEQCYGVGDVANLGALRQSISSIRVYGRATITVYENTDFRGRSAQFTSDVADLGRQMMAGNTAWSDHIDSLRITGSRDSNAGSNGNTGDYSRNSPRNSQATPRDGICVYELPNYQGRSQCWNQGQSIADLSRQDNWSSQISSIRLFGRAIALVYQEANYRGESMTVDRDIPDLEAVSTRSRGNGRGQDNSNGRGRGNNRERNWDHQIASIHVQEQR
jgi:hypothetical protein